MDKVQNNIIINLKDGDAQNLPKHLELNQMDENLQIQGTDSSCLEKGWNMDFTSGQQKPFLYTTHGKFDAYFCLARHLSMKVSLFYAERNKKLACCSISKHYLLNGNYLLNGL